MPAPSDDRPESALLDAILGNPLLGVVVLQDGRIAFASPTVARVSGLSVEALQALSAEEVMERIHPEDREAIQAGYAARIADQLPTASYRIRIRSEAGEFRSVTVHPMPVLFRGRPASCAVLVDETERFAAARQLEQRAAELAATRDRLESWLRERGEQLRDAQTYLATVFQHSYDGIGVVDAEGCFEHGNPASFRIVGWPREELIGDHFLKIFPPDTHPFMLERWKEVQRGEGRPYRTDIVTKDGERRRLQISHRHMEISGQRKYAVVLSDITELTQAQAALREHGEQLERTVAERTAALEDANARLRRTTRLLERAQALARVGSFTWDPAQRRVEWSREMRRLHGLPPEGRLPPPARLSKLCHPRDRVRLQRAMQRTLETGAPLDIEYRLRFEDGRIRHVRAQGERRAKCSEGAGYLLEGTLQDVTVRRELEQEIIEASQREQQRIGADLHDSLGQELSGLSMLAAALTTRMKECCPALVPDAQRISDVARVAVRHTKALAQGLAPIDIPAGGLETELRRMAERATELHAIPVSLRTSLQCRALDTRLATHLFYIAREAITNALSHAGASRIEVRLTTRGDRGRLSIRDDGRWQTAALDQPGVGLHIMQRRADLIDAELRIEPGATKGTRVVCLFPNSSDGSDDGEPA